MDCGPACLAAVFAGYGIAVNYGPLRDACQTDVDGTSIDSIEELATRLGLNAEQILIPVDHLLLDEAGALPAIVVITAPSGFTHFVVVWNVIGGFVQVMDPAIGRRWMRRERFLADVFVHEQAVPAADWEEWSHSDEFTETLRRRLRDLGVPDDIQKYFATDELHAKSIGRLDAAVRVVAALVAGGALAHGSAASSALTRILSGGEPPLLERWASARPFPADGAHSSRLSEHMMVRGAVAVRVRRAEGRVGPQMSDDLSPELRAVLSERTPSPLGALGLMLRDDGWLRPAVLLGALGIATVGVLLEGLVLRGLIDIGHDLALAQQRWAAVAALALLLVMLLALELPIGWGMLGMARRLELRFRVALLRRIPLLGDRYFGTRPLSDMAERAHAVHQLRSVGDTGWILCRSVFELTAVTVALVWFWPTAWLSVVALAATSAGLPLLTNGPVRERDLRARTHLGALSRFYLDALLGLVAVRAHGADRAIQREHENLLVEWVRASRARLRVTVMSEAAQLSVGLAISAWLVYRYLTQESATGGVLLLAYWAFRLPALGDEIALVARRYPMQRSIVLRLMEPLTLKPDRELEDLTAGVSLPAVPARPYAVEMHRVSVVIGGNSILRDISLTVPAGTHVAIVGRSGAGKSTLLALLLGWLRPTSGDLRLAGAVLQGSHLDTIRRGTAWVDPSVQLWNQTMLQNLVYGSDPESIAELPRVIEDAGLRALLQQLPNGMATVLGEGGALVSGGEGQRVRLARALLRTDAGLVVADEPFRGLEVDARDSMAGQLRERFRQATLLLATHDVAATLGFDRVLVMHDGEIVEDDAPATLAARAGSRYGGFLESDRLVRDRLWRSGAWQRLTLAGGVIMDPAIPAMRPRTHLALDEGSPRWTA